jgi:hypothetical protein
MFQPSHFSHSYNNPLLQNLDSLHSCFQQLSAQSKIVIHLQQNNAKETIVLMANVNWKTLGNLHTNKTPDGFYTKPNP